MPENKARNMVVAIVFIFEIGFCFLFIIAIIIGVININILKTSCFLVVSFSLFEISHTHGVVAVD